VIYTLTMNPAVDRTVTVSRFEAWATNRVQDVTIEGRGKGINVSLALKEFGLESLAFAPIGGAEGEIIREALQQAGIEHNLYQLQSGSTRVNIKIYDKETQITTEVNEPGPHLSADDCKAISDMVLDALRPGDILVCAGSLPPGVPDDFYAYVIRLAKQKDVFCVLDASGEPFRRGLAAGPHMAKPNRSEAEAWFGQSLSTKTALMDCLDDFINLGLSLAIISLGKDGAVFRRAGEGIVWAAAASCDARSTVGCGDVMLAASISAVVQGKPLVDLARFATGAATAAAEQPGTAVPDSDAVEALLDRVNVEIRQEE
jgi:1-phosphofructokinase